MAPLSQYLSLFSILGLATSAPAGTFSSTIPDLPSLSKRMSPFPQWQSECSTSEQGSSGPTGNAIKAVIYFFRDDFLGGESRCGIPKQTKWCGVCQGAEFRYHNDSERDVCVNMSDVNDEYGELYKRGNQPGPGDCSATLGTDAMAVTFVGTEGRWSDNCENHCGDSAVFGIGSVFGAFSPSAMQPAP